MIISLFHFISSTFTTKASAIISNMAAGTRNQQGQLKQQTSDLILNDDSIVKLIAEAVSTLIVERLKNEQQGNDQKVATSITKEPTFVETIAGDVIHKIANDLNDKKKELVWDLDGLEQYSRRNCLLVHGVAEP